MKWCYIETNGAEVKSFFAIYAECQWQDNMQGQSDSSPHFINAIQYFLGYMYKKLYEN